MTMDDPVEWIFRSISGREQGGEEERKRSLPLQGREGMRRIGLIKILTFHLGFVRKETGDKR